MTIGSTFKTAGGLAAFIAFVFGTSYCSEAPKYRFERMAADAGKQIPGARLIGSTKLTDVSSPVSWFWPATTMWNFATPDPQMRDRFYVIGLNYERAEPSVYLLDVDCKARNAEWFDLDEPATALPARNVWGEPVVAPNGQTYRRSKATIAPPSKWLTAFCETDWTAEREATGAAMFGKREAK